MKFFNPIKSITNTYNKLSNWGKILFFVLLLLLVIVLLKNFKIPAKEGFEQNEHFLTKTGMAVYDKFYADIYDQLTYNNIKDDYEVGEIINKTQPTSESKILDIGSGTGQHVEDLASKGFDAIGIDSSEEMVKKSENNFPKNKYIHGDVLNSLQFKNEIFTHILCLYFTIYYIKDKNLFFKNCYNWLMPGGYLIVHLVNRDMFDPILPPNNSTLIVSPQRYLNKRVTSTKISLNDLHYSSEFDLNSDNNLAIVREKFKNKETGKVRRNEHILYMEPEEDILVMAKNAGFIVESKIDLLKCNYEYQYLYVLLKPN